LNRAIGGILALVVIPSYRQLKLKWKRYKIMFEALRHSLNFPSGGKFGSVKYVGHAAFHFVEQYCSLKE
jgi:hypothetical protein